MNNRSLIVELFGSIKIRDGRSTSDFSSSNSTCPLFVIIHRTEKNNISLMLDLKNDDYHYPTCVTWKNLLSIILLIHFSPEYIQWPGFSKRSSPGLWLYASMGVKSDLARIIHIRNYISWVLKSPMFSTAIGSRRFALKIRLIIRLIASEWWNT